jgi:molecular chaperone HscB
MRAPTFDPFATLGIERVYDVDLRAVEKVHRDLSRTLHPDRYVAGSASERREALARAVEVNEAWRIVRDPVRRAEALLSLSEIKTQDEGEVRLPADFLLEMLEQREALAAAKAARDLPGVRRLGEAVRASAGDTERELADGLSGGERDAPGRALGKLRFYRRFLGEVNAIEDELV